MTNPDPLAAILAEAERNRRQERAASASAGTVSVPAAAGDATVNASGGGGGGNSVVLDQNGKIPQELLYPAPTGETARTFTFRQDTAAQVWTIAHQLGGYPEPVLVDGSGQPLPMGEVRYPDANHVVIVFGHPRTGVAHLSL